MRFIVAAVGTKMPRWVDEAFSDYAARMPRPFGMQLAEVRAEPRTEGKPVPAMLEAEAARLAAALPQGCFRVALDERGAELGTAAFAKWVEARTGEGRDVAFMVGGPDGLAASIRNGADLTLRLSAFTLPHALARVVLAEQIYRALSILRNHPYHRA
jgi:23S rRNA (pseudouridine1915-N3)-methyltransferase